MNAINIQSVSKTYRDVKAVNDISLSIPQQSIFGLLGPNGAGKTSLIRMITQITAPDTGEILFYDHPQEEEDTSEIGYLPEERGLYKKMSVGDQLLYLARLKDMDKTLAEERIDVWLKRFDLVDWKDKYVEDLSKGMQQKVQFISTVIHEPKLVILDEPFSGLDPINTNMIKNEIFRLVNEEKTTVIFSTHRMEQVEEICEYIALINKGKCVLSGKVDELKEKYKKNVYQLISPTEITDELNEKYLVEQGEGPNEYLFHLKEGQDANVLLKDILDQKVQVVGFNEVLPTMNEIFIETVNQPL